MVQQLQDISFQVIVDDDAGENHRQQGTAIIRLVRVLDPAKQNPGWAQVRTDIMTELVRGPSYQEACKEAEKRAEEIRSALGLNFDWLVTYRMAATIDGGELTCNVQAADARSAMTKFLAMTFDKNTYYISIVRK